MVGVYLDGITHQIIKVFSSFKKYIQSKKVLFDLQNLRTRQCSPDCVKY